MGLSDATQTLVAAFSFGILVQAALSANLLYFGGHGATILKERRRLVLVIFLLMSTLWSLFDFVNFMIPKPATGMLNFCQITTAVSSSLDQIARVAIGGFLLWTVGHNTKTSGEKYGLGVLVTIRILAGGFFVGFVRPQFEPLCLARSSLLPASIGVLALDVIIIGVIFTRFFTLRLWRAMRQDISGTDQTICKSLMLVSTGFAFWTAASVAMILGFESTIFLLRTAVPAIGLTILISIIALYPGVLLLEREEESRLTQEARSPFTSPPSRSGESFSSQSPVIPRTYTKGGLFVVNPSDSPNDSSRVAFSNPRNVEDDGSRKYVPNTTITQMEIDDSDTKGINRKHTSSGVFGTILTPPVVSTAGNQYQENVKELPKATIVTTASFLPENSFRDLPKSPPKKKSIFGRSASPPKKSVRMMEISAPIVIDAVAATTTPFARIRTVDLVTAAACEKERREESAARALVAKRPAPRPPKPAGLEDLQMSNSIKRKQVKSIRVPPPPMRVLESEGGLSVNANTSGASLSPGIEDIRRRSPRDVNTDHDGLNKFDSSDANRSQPRTKIRAQPPVDTTRLNPLRMQKPNQETVMYIKDIVYDQPGMVDSIMSGVPAMIAKAKKTPVTPLQTPQSSASIMHRPRPYKRGSETNSAFFKNESYSPNHRRSNSGGAIPSKTFVNKKYLLRSQPGSPTGLPALPPLPTSASRLKRLLPNDTRSMTLDEKILLLFPAPLGVPGHQRRSSVPSLPRIPSSIWQEESMGLNADELDTSDRGASKRTTISFGATPDLNLFSPKSASQGLVENLTFGAEIPVTKPAEDGYTYRFSARTYGTLLEGPPDSGAPKFPLHGIPKFLESNNSVAEDVKSESGDTYDDARSVWASLHSPISAIRIQGGRANAIHMGLDGSTTNADGHLSALPTVAANTNSKSSKDEFITFELAGNSLNTGNGLPVFFLDASPSLPDEQPSKSIIGSTWHHRLGDHLPTFSGRKENRLRGMPPPPPLRLSSSSRQVRIVKETIDSPRRAIQQIQAQLEQFEDPERDSLASILDNLPDAAVKTPSGRNADRLDVLANLEAEMAGQECHWMQMQHDFDRDSNSVTILSPEVQNLKSRGHISPPPESDIPSRSSSTSSSIRSISKRSRRGTTDTKSVDTSSTESPQNSRASVWQRRLAEAQMEYTENAPELQMKRNLNFLTLKKSLPQPGSPSPPESVSSADDSTQFDSESETEYEPAFAKITAAPLWRPKSLSAPITKGDIWTAPEQPVREASPEPPAKSVRPTMRKIQKPLTIESSDLWFKTKRTSHIPPVGLWGTKLSRPVSINTRPKTQRPQRKHRRVTLLPDIVESPSPLPNKRETLGIFQFPWGEKSDQPMYRHTAMPIRANVLGSNMLNSSPEVESRMSESEEYESSFFDDYDDIEDYENEGPQDSSDDFDESTLWEIANLLHSQDVPSRNSLLPSNRVSIIEDYDDSGSEDEIVESTNRKPSVVKFIPIQPLRMTPSPQQSPLPTPQQPLWTKDPEAPLPPPKDTVLQPQARVRQSYIPTNEPVRVNSRDTLTIQSLTSGELWETPGIDMTLPEQLAATLCVGHGEVKSKQPSTQGPSTPLSEDIIGLGVAVDSELERLRPQQIPRRTSSMLFSSSGDLESKALWDKAIDAVTSMNTAKEESSDLWTAEPAAKTMPGTMTSAKLWTPRERQLVAQAASLFIAGVQKNSFRASDNSLAAVDTVRKPRTAAEMLTTLTSSTLWSPLNINTNIQEPNWTVKATARPLSRAMSISSDESNVCTADSDEAPLSPTNTKAPSLCAELTNPANSSLRSGDVTAVLPNVDAQKHISKLPIKTPSNRFPNTQLPTLVPGNLEGGRNGKSKSMVGGFDADTECFVGKPAIKARKSTGRIAATEEQWMEALNRATKEGTPRIRRPSATKVQWEQALNEAVENSTPRLQRQWTTSEDRKASLSAAISYVPVTPQRSLPQFDVSVRHPAFFTISTSTTEASFVHPAFEGYIKPAVSRASLQLQRSTPQFDVSIRHPTFFITSFTTKAHSVHPAMEGYVIPSIRTQLSIPRQVSITLWSPTVLVDEVKSEGLWISRPVVQDVRPSLFEHLAVIHVLKRNNKTPTTSPTVASNSLWHEEKQNVAVGKHWLRETSKTFSIRIRAPVSSSETTSAPLWTEQAGERQEMFADLVSRPVLKQDTEMTEDLPILTKTRASAWLAAPKHTMSTSGKPLIAPSIIPTTTASKTQPIAESATPTPKHTLVPTVFQTILPKPLLKRAQTLAPTGRKSVWTAPALASTTTPKPTSALWNPSIPVVPGASRPKSPEDMFASSNGVSEATGLRLSRGSRSLRMSRGMEGQEVEKEKERMSKEGQKTWRPKWGLPERPTQWLEQGKEKRRIVEFRY